MSCNTLNHHQVYISPGVLCPITRGSVGGGGGVSTSVSYIARCGSSCCEHYTCTYSNVQNGKACYRVIHLRMLIPHICICTEYACTIS